MAESPEELGKEIDRLWAKVAASSVEAAETVALPSSQPPAAHEAAWEAMNLLKKQHLHESRYWAEVLETKERALASMRERQALMEGELRSLRQRVQSDEARIVGEGLEAKSRIEAAFAAMEEERAKHDEEQKRIRALLDETRRRWQTEAESWRLEREQWDKRAQKDLTDLKEVQALAARHQKDAAGASDQSRKLEQSLKEAKNALEKTLSELLRERQIRDESEKERDKALKKVDEVQKHFEELSKIWEEERAQWRELWDRERSTWETQRQEFSSWEESLRKERLAWQGEMSSKEKTQLEHVDQLTETLRQSAETSTKMAAELRLQDYEARKRWIARRSFAGRWLLSAALACAILVPVARYAMRYHFKQVSVDAFDRSDASGLAFDGALLWTTRWDGALEALDPRDLRKIREALPNAAQPYRPTALAFGNGYLWTLDAAQARLLRHKAAAPEEVVASRPSPGPAPTALAFDGESLWSFDAANKALYKHGADEATYKAVAMEGDAVVTTMAWIGGELWVYDGKSRDLLVFSSKDDKLALRGRYPLGEPVVGMLGVKVNVSGKTRRQLWVLAGPKADRTGFAVLRYEY